MKLVFLLDDCPPSSFGGAGIVAFEQAKEMVKRGHQVLIVTTTRDRGEEGRTTFDGVDIERIYTNYHERWRAYLSLYNFQVVDKIGKILRKESPDIVHAHNIHNWISYWTLVSARKYSKVVCITTRDAMTIEYGKLHQSIVKGNDGAMLSDFKISLLQQVRTNKLRWNPLRNPLIKMFLSMVDCHIVPSRSLADGLSQNNVEVSRVLYDGIDLSRFKQSKIRVENFKRDYHLEGKRVIFFGGRISAAKGAMAALDIFEAVLKEMPDTVLLLLGKEDEYLRHFLNTAQGRGIRDKIICLGWLERDLMPVAYEASHLVLVLSLYLDPFPTINLEAMAMSRPVIGTCFGGTPEIVSDGVNGYIVNPNDTSKASRLALNLLGDGGLRDRLGWAGRATVEQRCDISKVGKELEELYRSLLQRRS